MAFECRVERDSVSVRGDRITTFVVTFPRFILAEFNTHRALSRNAASSRAIPVAKRIQQVIDDPFVPEQFGRNQKGMQASLSLDASEHEAALYEWNKAKDNAIQSAKALAELGVHKQLANRILEPFCWATVIATATDWNNFFALRCHKDAQPEFRKIAEMMRAARESSTPAVVEDGEWHFPFLADEEVPRLRGTPFAEWQEKLSRAQKVSVGRCARVSYLTHDGKRDEAEDVRLTNDLRSHEPRHSSPFEHPASPCPGRWHNLSGWESMRSAMRNEHVRG